MKILYITQCSVYDNVSHAGGMTVNYYINKFKHEHDVFMVSFCDREEEKKVISLNPDVKVFTIVRDEKSINEILGKIYSLPFKLNIFDKRCGFSKYATHLLIKKLKHVSNCLKPDIIILEWTGIVLHIDIIRRLFPEIPIIASEHDVSYLGAFRKVENEKNWVKKCIKNIKAKWLKKMEIECLKQADLIVPHNDKDKILLLNEELENEKIHVITPYYHEFASEKIERNTDILFFGYMAREENVNAVMWFIKEVMPLVEDLNIRFVVVGGGSDNLKYLQTERVHIVGYVEDPSKWFYESMCFVAPLNLGAGIKVKVIEAMYTGITVLTNKIGIEGINAEAGVDYYHCENAEEYAETIRKIYNDELPKINGKKVIEKDFSLEKSFERYALKIKELAES